MISCDILSLCPSIKMEEINQIVSEETKKLYQDSEVKQNLTKTSNLIIK